MSVSRLLLPTSYLMLAALSASLQILPVIVELLQAHDAILQTGSVANLIMRQLVHFSDTFIFQSKPVRSS